MVCLTPLVTEGKIVFMFHMRNQVLGNVVPVFTSVFTAGATHVPRQTDDAPVV